MGVQAETAEALLKLRREAEERTRREYEQELAQKKVAADKREFAEKVPVPEAYRCIRSFDTIVGHATVSFQEGQLITDPTLINLLLESGCEIAPALYLEWHNCPSCGYKFPGKKY